VCSRYFVIVFVADMCGCQPAGLGIYVSVYVCSHVAGGVRCMESCYSFKIATAAAALVCLLCCLWRLMRSARHGTANDDGHGASPPACVWRRVLGGFGGRPLGRAQRVRSCLDLAAWLAGVRVSDRLREASRWWRPRRCRPRVVGRVGAGGWVGG
jgi:hypothetical protein